jgi:hypothetical protein
MILFAVITTLGVALFGALAWRSVSIDSADATDAEHQFNEARAALPALPPLVARGADGRFVRRPITQPGTLRATTLHVLAYHSHQQRLLRADVPLWLARIKGPAAQYALRDTGFDLETLNLTARDLEDFGAGVVLDESDASGDRVLAWTE